MRFPLLFCFAQWNFADFYHLKAFRLNSGIYKLHFFVVNPLIKVPESSYLPP